MKNMFGMILLITVSMQIQCLHAQCVFNMTILTQGAACGATGSITLQTSTATGPFQFKLDSLSSNLVPYTTSNMFQGLYPGIYTVIIKDLNTGCDTTLPNIIVDTIALPMLLAISPQHVTGCNNGTITYAASGGTLPYAYNLTGNGISISNPSAGTFTGLAPGSYTVSVTDQCGNLQTRDTTILGLNWSILNDSTLKLACDSYRVHYVQLSHVLPGVIYSVKYGSTTLASGSLPLNFSHPDSIMQNVMLCATYCGTTHCKTLNQTLDWSFTGPLIQYTGCNQFTVSSFQIYGNPVLPLQYGVALTNPVDTIVSTLPIFSFTRSNNSNVSVRFFVQDACGKKWSTSSTLGFGFKTFIQFDSCHKSTLTIAPLGYYLPPLQYSVNHGPYQSSNVFPNLADGNYIVKVRDQCLDSITSMILIDHSWKCSVSTSIHCNIGYYRDAISLARRMMPPVTIKRYQQTYLQLVDSVQFTYPEFGDGNAGKTESISTKYFFYNSLPNTTYLYVLIDACGRSDTVIRPHGPNGLLPYVLNGTVQPLCIDRGNIIVDFSHNGSLGNHVLLSIWDINQPANPIVSDVNTGTTMGTHTFLDLPVGTYVVRMKTMSCPLETFDTVTVPIYTQTDILYGSASYIGPNTILCTAQGQYGVTPYTYKILGTVPPGGPLLTSGTGVFIISGQYDSIQVRVQDSCQNGVTQTLYVYPQGQFPLSLGALNASAKPIFSGAMIQWTSREQGVQFFRIERSADAVHFDKLVDVQAESNTHHTHTYQFPDNWSMPFIAPTLYYRVVSYVNDQVLNRSNIVSVTHADVSTGLQIFPLPFREYFDVHLYSDIDQQAQFQIYDLTGRCILHYDKNLQAGDNRLKFMNFQSVLPGNYLLRYTDEQGNQVVKKLVKL